MVTLEELGFESNLGNGGRNTSQTTLTAKAFALRLVDDIPSMSRLSGIEAREIS
jgi:hypothetical protein